METARRTLTRPAMLFCLAIFHYRQSVSRLKQKVMAFALKAATALLFGQIRGRITKRGTGAQNEPQKEILNSPLESQNKTNIAPEPSQDVNNIYQSVQGKTLAEWNFQIAKTRIQGQINAAESRYHARQEKLSAETRQLKGMLLKMLSTFRPGYGVKPDNAFRASYSNVEYGTIPNGFHG
ncbi:hypothetical protein [Atlantibacter hermannii]|uniref:hypothetical protein n=1 Tax=Atlantibacter hermannii TaxID=565 RepID=UPI0028A17731|nr:hypothetical protein [Atlantibacter hermannii]